MVPPGRHYKNAIESKHSIIRSIYLRILDNCNNINPSIAALRAVAVSNDLYGNHTVSAYEMAKGYTRPFEGSPISLPQEMLDAHLNMQARRKLSMIMRSKATKEIPLSIGEMVEVYQKGMNGKRGHWSVPKENSKYQSRREEAFCSWKGRTSDLYFFRR